MKVHIFRRVRDEVSPDYYDLNDRYPLYAITTKKKYAKRFMKERVDKKFIYTVVDKDEDDVDDYLRAHRGRVLNLYDMETYVNRHTDEQDVRYASVLLTDDEVTFTMESIETRNILNRFTSVYVPSTIFTEDLYQALKDLYYVAAERKALQDAYMMDDKTLVGPGDEIDFLESVETDLLGVTFDQLNCFIFLYNGVLSEKFYTGIQLSKEPTGTEPYSF